MATFAVVAPDTAWPAQFEALRDGLLAAFAPASVVIEHVGSTAVRGLAAKPVIDMMLGAASLAAIEARIPALAAAGYEYVARHEATLPERRYFTRPAGTLPAVHLHAVVADGTFWRRHLAFRDALRADPALAARYGRLKRELADRFAHDRAAYTAAKAPFIAAVLADAGFDLP